MAGDGGALAEVADGGAPADPTAGFELAPWVGDVDDDDMLVGATAPATDPTAWVIGCTTAPAAWVTELTGAPPDDELEAVEPSANSSAAATPVDGTPAEPTSAATAVATTIKHRRPRRQRQFMRGLRVQPHARLDVRDPSKPRHSNET